MRFLGTKNQVMLRPDVITTVLFLGAGAALADEAGDCGHPVPDRSIRGCSLLVERTGTTPRELAAAYVLRGGAYIIVGDLDRAKTDLDDALRLRSDDPEAFTTRADAYLRKAGISDYLRESNAAYRRNETYTKTEQDQTRRGYYEQAIADYSRALVHNPRHLAAYFGRSLAHRALGSMRIEPVMTREPPIIQAPHTSAAIKALMPCGKSHLCLIQKVIGESLPRGLHRSMRRSVKR
jgi:tetratricopeptide (TPR) repeat protein